MINLGQNRTPDKKNSEIFASGDSPEHLESKYILFKKPDSAPKIRIPVSGKNPGHKKTLVSNHFG